MGQTTGIGLLDELENKYSLVHPYCGGMKPVDNLFVINDKQNYKDCDDESNHIVPCIIA